MPVDYAPPSTPSTSLSFQATCNCRGFARTLALQSVTGRVPSDAAFLDPPYNSQCKRTFKHLPFDGMN